MNQIFHQKAILLFSETLSFGKTLDFEIKAFHFHSIEFSFNLWGYSLMMSDVLGLF